MTIKGSFASLPGRPLLANARGFHRNQSGVLSLVSAPRVNSGAVSGLIYWRNPFGLLNKLRNHSNKLSSDGSILEQLMAPRSVPPLPAVPFEVAVIGATITTAQQKKLSASAYSATR